MSARHSLQAFPSVYSARLQQAVGAQGGWLRVPVHCGPSAGVYSHPYSTFQRDSLKGGRLAALLKAAQDAGALTESQIPAFLQGLGSHRGPRRGISKLKLFLFVCLAGLGIEPTALHRLGKFSAT